MYQCTFCDKECKNKRSLSSHQNLCKLNPDKRESGFSKANKNGNINHSTTKGRSLSDDHKKKLSNSRKGKPFIISEENEKLRRAKISNTMKKNPNAGGYRQGSGRCKGSWYDSIYAGRVFLDSSWELEYAKWLDENQIKWQRNKSKFPYEWKDKIRNYIPDFYIEESNSYVEVKGYKTDKDDAKWNSFPHELVVLYFDDLKQLGVLK